MPPIRPLLLSFPLLASAAGSLVSPAAAAADLDDPAEFARLHAVLKPTADEVRWLDIPWRTDLWEARREAAAAGKPILLWEMDGHPLGCT